MRSSVAANLSYAYTPRVLARLLAALDTPPRGPLSRRFEAITLFCDISGSTQLAEKMAGEGLAGMEKLAAVLNDCFGDLVVASESSGGDIVRFAGDALIAIWPLDEGDDPAELARRAAICGVRMLRGMERFNVRSNVELAIRIGIGRGGLSAMYVGGQFGRYELLTFGPSLIAATEAEHQAQRGELVASPEIASMLPREWLNKERDGFTILESWVMSGGTLLPTSRREDERRAFEALPDWCRAALEGNIPSAVRHRAAAGYTDWLAELRRLTVLFIHLPDIDHDSAVRDVNAAMCAVQDAVYNSEGSINKLLADDKGCFLLAAFGLPPLSHRDDPLRAVRSALAVQTSLLQIGQQCSIGVTTGRAFCGEVGDDNRREYTVLGTIVNLAARLMNRANGGLLCDRATRNAAPDAFRWTALTPLRLKGVAKPVPNFRPEPLEEYTDSVVPQDRVGSYRTASDGRSLFSDPASITLDETPVHGRLGIDTEELNRLPENLSGEILSYIDQLPPREQLCLKVASVVGTRVPLGLLREVYPVDSDRDDLEVIVDALVLRRFLRWEEGRRGETLLFRHGTVREAAYNLMLFSQRAELHRIIAQWVEGTFATSLDRNYGPLAFHWKAAGEPDKALHYLDLAATRALESGEMSEATSLLRSVLEEGTEAEASRRARWLCQLGEALLIAGDAPGARAALEDAVALGDRPSRPLTLIGAILRASVSRLIPTGLLRLLRRRSDEPAPRLWRAHIGLTRLHIAAGHPAAALGAAARGLHVARIRGDTPALAEADVGLALALAGWRPTLAVRLATRALSRAVGGGRIPVHLLLARHYLGEGAWGGVDGHARRAAARMRVGSEHLSETLHRIRGEAALLRGDLDRARECFDAVLTSSRSREATWQLCSALSLQAVTRQDQGARRDAAALIAEAMELDEALLPVSVRVLRGGVAARLAASRGNAAAVSDHLAASLALLDAAERPVDPMLHAGLVGLVEASVWTQATGHPDGSSVSLRARAHLDEHAAIRPVAQAQADLWAGHIAWLDDSHDAALERWRAALLAARSLGLRLVEARVSDALGRHLSSEEGEAHAIHAGTLLEACGAAPLHDPQAPVRARGAAR